ncbi:hypothetical protein GLOTRDRAFT_98973 [Gloeophyllum trabeum ATCC 11539]|uniref:Uncharacterized protein n=1 Tax=Gloeophyllum trabeum (strain ATCC 11539 / FP-39264 / Madison 617) TaxID=670483 RepID=S7QG49_GLOTA|nr:uncharacterized protein GLOTRDRAFT_98973 [Gloeophyllum trabeum ATCC 11539]EPQ58402.1 hypothetical protein GLOTRDRAFT_98973 [Gloeophyllum trabeum ATCC 11539]
MAATQFMQYEKRYTHLVKEYAELNRTSRRALHELEISSFDLKLAEERRKVADAQLEKAKVGALGIDYVKSS